MDERSRNPVVAGVDDAVPTLQAVRWAALEADHRGLGLKLVHATDELSLNYPRGLPTSDDLRGIARMRGKRFLCAAREAARAVVPGIEPELVLRREGAAAALVEEAESASLLVLGTPGLRPLGRLLAGSATVALAAHAACPVALVRSHAGDDEFPSEGPVVVGVDDSPTSDEALPLAFEEASWRRVPLVAVRAWDDAFLAGVWEELRENRYESEVHEQETEELAARLAGWQEKYPDVRVDQVVRRGRPATALLDFADHAQLLVVGSRGRGDFAGLLLGSTSQTLMSSALCPVLIARHGR